MQDAQEGVTRSVAAENTVAAAVLVPVYRRGGKELRLILVRRGEQGVHGGQLAFPGGKKEPGDRTLVETALRETREEIGLEPDKVRILERLPIVETISTGFRITPFLARIEPPREWNCREEEVAEVLDIPLGVLTNRDLHGHRHIQLPTWHGPKPVPFIKVGGRELWGATYRILFPLIPRLLADEWPI